MKNKILYKNILLLIAVAFLLSNCKNEEFDGLQNVDPAPAYAITFPDAMGSNGFPQMDDNAFIINQNSIAEGNSVVVRIQAPTGKEITTLTVRGQRFRGVIVEPNISPTVPTAATSRAPAAFTRVMNPNLGNNLSISSGNTAEFVIPLNALPTTLSGTLGAVQINDVFRFYFLVNFLGGASALSTEVRVVVKG